MTARTLPFFPNPSPRYFCIPQELASLGGQAQGLLREGSARRLSNAETQALEPFLEGSPVFNLATRTVAGDGFVYNDTLYFRGVTGGGQEPALYEVANLQDLSLSTGAQHVLQSGQARKLSAEAAAALEPRLPATPCFRMDSPAASGEGYVHEGVVYFKGRVGASPPQSLQAPALFEVSTLQALGITPELRNPQALLKRAQAVNGAPRPVRPLEGALDRLPHAWIDTPDTNALESDGTEVFVRGGHVYVNQFRMSSVPLRWTPYDFWEDYGPVPR